MTIEPDKVAGKSFDGKVDDEVAAQYLTFHLGDELYGIGIQTVREIIQVGPMTAVPMMPAFVRGVINLRGAVVPVIDLPARFDRPPAVIGKKSCIVIFDSMRDSERVELGLLVDAVSEVIEIGPDAIDPPPQFGTSIRRTFIEGIGKCERGFVVLLAPDRAFDLDDMERLCERSQRLQAA